MLIQRGIRILSLLRAVVDRAKSNTLLSLSLLNQACRTVLESALLNLLLSWIGLNQTYRCLGQGLVKLTAVMDRA